MKAILLAGALAISAAASAMAADLSPDRWPKADRERVEALEFEGPSPSVARTVSGAGGVVSATVSPIAVYAGVQALNQGGDAADAAVTVALTQITTQLGSVVSYAGIITGLYYDARTGEVHSLDGGYNSYLGEHDPRSIPVGDLGPLNFGRKPTVGGAKGRETLVPGFMAGLEALHRRYGRLKFADLFAPAIWYDEHGVRISATHKRYFDMRQQQLARTAEGRAFLAQAGSPVPEVGQLFKQAELARTLRAVAEHGSAYMYTGPWAQEFVRIVQREGGKVTAEDLARYRPSWDAPRHETVFGHEVYVNGGLHASAYTLLPALNLAEARGLASRGPYWSDPETFSDLTHINEAVTDAPQLPAQVAALLKAKGVDASPRAQLTKAYAQALAPLLDELFPVAEVQTPRHSNSIVVVDKEGNVAAITHTINSVVWGDTGIVVGGVPIPDSAAFQQAALAAIKPGERLPHQILDTIALKDGRPVLATASIGSSLVPETIRTLVGVLGQGQTLRQVMEEPPLLSNFADAAAPIEQRSVPVPKGAYAPALLEALRKQGLAVTELPEETARVLRGTLATVQRDAGSGRWEAPEQPGVMVFDAAQ